MLSRRIASTLAASASETWASVSHSTSMGRSVAAPQALDCRRVPSRTAARWLSFTSTASSRPKRWFLPPPQATACFSSRAKARCGLACVEDRDAVFPRRRRRSCESSVAIPESLPRKLSATRSPVRIARSGPETTATTVMRSTGVPSSTRASNRTSGSSARNTASAAASPQTTPSSFTSSSAVPRASASTVASVVTSPAPTSSASAA